MNKKIISCCLILLAAPLIIAMGVWMFQDRRYNLIILALVLVSMIPFFLSFEKRQRPTRRLMLIAVLTALSVASRFLFAEIPFFKPVTSIVIITGIYLGPEAGFLCGSFSALLSNFYFGQGPWTPFQMLTWGMLGFLSGLPSLLKNKDGRRMMEHPAALVLWGGFSGVIYSLVMDVWTTVSADSTFSWARYFSAITLSLPYTIVYGLSNIVFLLLLAKPLGKKLRRVMVKYGI